MTASEPCFVALRDSILSGDLLPGARLPAERRLAEQYGVNRVSVRSALARLAASRLVSVRQGSGYIVRDFRAVAGPELLPGLASLAARSGQTGAIADDLLLVRRSLARGVLERFTRTPPTPAALAHLGAAIAAFATAVEAGAAPDELARRDLDVLRSLLDATGSPVLSLCLNPIAEALETLPRLRGAVYVNPSSNVAGWHALLGWLGSPSPDLLEPIMQLLAARDAATVQRLTHD